MELVDGTTSQSMWEGTIVVSLKEERGIDNFFVTWSHRLRHYYHDSVGKYFEFLQILPRTLSILRILLPFLREQLLLVLIDCFHDLGAELHLVEVCGPHKGRFGVLVDL